MTNSQVARKIRPAVYTAAGLLLLTIMFAASLMLGSTTLMPRVIWEYASGYSTSVREHLIIHTVRLPRAIAAAITGANLAAAGCIMQAITRNPLASPGIFGIQAGASFVIVLSMVLFPAAHGLALASASFGGGLLATVLIVAMSAVLRGGRPEVKMALIGVVIGSLLSAFTQGVLIFNEDSTQRLLFWLAGSAAGTKWTDVHLLAPLSAAGLLGALLIAKSMSLISLGDDTARSLGLSLWRIRVIGSAIVIVLTGITVAVVGPVGFVGLIVPHLARYLIGTDYRMVIPFSVLLGALLVTAADIASRFVSFPSETPLGIVTALVGAPYFVYLARKQGGGK